MWVCEGRAEGVWMGGGRTALPEPLSGSPGQGHRRWGCAPTAAPVRPAATMTRAVTHTRHTVRCPALTSRV